MVKFLDYEGLNKYNDLIVKFIKSGDKELLDMIMEIKDTLEGSDSASVANQIAALDEALGKKIADLEAKHNADKVELNSTIESKVKDAVDSIVDGAPEALDTLKEIADLLASDEAGVADLLSEVIENKKAIEENKANILAANEAYERQEERLANVESIIGVDSDSDSESVIDRLDKVDDRLDAGDDRLDDIDEKLDDITSITAAEIAMLFLNGSQSESPVKYASSAASVKSISAAEAKTTDLIVTSDEAVNALTENKIYKSVAIGSTDIDTKLTVKAVEDVVIDGANVNGRGEDATGNGSINYAAKDLKVQNMNISGNTNYNVFEGTQVLSDSESHIENLDFSNIVVEDPSIKHNIVNVYTPADGAKITISDSKFTLNPESSNVLRVSNYLNSDNIEITFKDCEWSYIDGDKTYAGLFLYQAAGADSAVQGDTSHIATWKIKFINCKYNGELVVANEIGDNQAMYAYNVGGTKTLWGGSDAVTKPGWEVIFE